MLHVLEPFRHSYPEPCSNMHTVQNDQTFRALGPITKPRLITQGYIALCCQQQSYKMKINHEFKVFSLHRLWNSFPNCILIFHLLISILNRCSTFHCLLWLANSCISVPGRCILIDDQLPDYNRQNVYSLVTFYCILSHTDDR